MSFILEALRRSERERQAGEVPSLPDLVAPTPALPRKPWLPWLVAALLLFNGIGIAYLLLNGREGVLYGKPLKPTAARANVSMPGHPAITPGPPQPIPAVNSPLPPRSAPVVPPSMVPTLPPAMVAPAAPPSTLTSQNALNSGPSMQTHHSSTPPVSTRHAAEPSFRTTVPPPSHIPVVPEIPKVKSAPGQSPAPSASASLARRGQAVFEAEEDDGLATGPAVSGRRNDLPLLGEMPSDFRAKVPAFRVNIFAYSKAKAERFAIIDMKKYVTGQELPGGLKLLEIRQDSMVLDWEGTRFRVPRP